MSQIGGLACRSPASAARKGFRDGGGAGMTAAPSSGFLTDCGIEGAKSARPNGPGRAQGSPGVVRIGRHCEERKRRSNPKRESALPYGALDCFAALAMTIAPRANLGNRASLLRRLLHLGVDALRRVHRGGSEPDDLRLVEA